MLLLAHWSPKFFDPVVLSMMLNCHEEKSFLILLVYLFTKFSKKLLLGNNHLDTFKTFIFLPDSHEYFAHTVQAFLPYCICGLSLDLLTVLTPASIATFLYHSTWFSLCFHIFLWNKFGAVVSKTIFNPLIQFLMYVQTISCTKRIRASIIFYLDCLHFCFPICIIVLTFSDGDQPLSTNILLLFTKSDEFFFWWQIYCA